MQSSLSQIYDHHIFFSAFWLVWSSVAIFDPTVKQDVQEDC